jgi:beta-lactam-binding protein with PASTA domain
MPDITGDTVSAGNDTLEASFPWLTGDISIEATFACSASVAANDIISQVPTASSEVEAEPAFEAVVSTGPCALLKRRRR